MYGTVTVSIGLNAPMRSLSDRGGTLALGKSPSRHRWSGDGCWRVSRIVLIARIVGVVS